MAKGLTDQLEKQSLLLIGSALIGHVGNYAYHVITGRMLPASEYGLMMALFGAVNLILLPMSAFNVSLARAVASLAKQGENGAITALLRTWLFRLTGLASAGLLVLAALSPLLQNLFEVNRLAPLILAALIPGLNLYLTLTGAALQGLQQFKGLALRGSLLFVVRALLVGACLSLGFTAAGWGLLAHVLAMLVALGISIFFLWPHLESFEPRKERTSVLQGSLMAFPVLLGFSALMTADVILVRALHPEDLSGSFAQAATLGRMILWLPLPIAQVMFPKVVRTGAASDAQKNTLIKALGYTVALVSVALTGAWISGPLLFQILFGQPATPAQLGWLRGIGLCMAMLGPVYVVIQYELARGRIRRLLPLCALALVYVGTAWIRNVSPDLLIRLLLVASVLSLLTAARALAAEPDLRSCP